MKTVEELAREAGFEVHERKKQVRVGIDALVGIDSTAKLERFRDLVLEEAAKACDSISEDQWALYKGRKPYTGREHGRFSDVVQGKADGADHCAQSIRAMKGQK